VPITTASQSTALIVPLEVRLLLVAVAHGRQQGADLGYCSKVSAMRPTAQGRGSTSSAAPMRMAATTPAP
jgi:hypothetical protein